MKCIVCGGREAVADGLCEECLRERVAPFRVDPYMDITVCPHCGAVRERRAWLPVDDLMAHLESFVRRHVEVSCTLDKLEIEVTLGREERRVFPVTVVATGMYRGVRITSELHSTLRLKSEACPTCSRYFGNYFEAILQLRAEGSFREGELEDIKREVYDLAARIREGNRKFFITKDGEMHGGWDFYLSDKHEAKKIARYLGEKYGADVGESPQIGGRRDGQDVYRVTYSVRLPPYREGDFVRFRDGIYMVMRTGGKWVKLINAVDGRTCQVKRTDFGREMKLLATREDVESAVVVSYTDREVQVLDPRTYETVTIRRPPGFSGEEEIRVVRIEDELYGVPK